MVENGPEVALRPRSADGLVEVNTGVPVQVVSAGANRWKVTVPVGVNPPLTVAVSEMEVPTGPPAEGVVAMVGVAWVMVSGSQVLVEPV